MTNSRDFRVEIIRNIEELNAMEEIWSDLLDKCPDKNPFFTFNWICAWWEFFGMGRQLFVMVIYSRGEVCGIVPLMISREVLLGITLRKLQFIGVKKSDYMGAIFVEDYELCWRLAIETIYENRSLWDVVELARMREESDAFTALSQVLSSREQDIKYFFKHDNNCKGCPTIIMHGDWKQYCDENLSTKTLSKMRAYIRRIEKKADEKISFVEIVDKDKIREAFKEVSDLECRSWKGEEQKGIFKGERNREFLSRVCSVFAEAGVFSIYMLRLDNTLVAYAIGFNYGQKYYFYNTAYDPLWRMYSPGSILLMKIIEECFDKKNTEFDMLQGEDEYKLKVTNKIWKIKKVLLFHNGWRSLGLHVLERHIRPVACAVRDKIYSGKKG